MGEIYKLGDIDNERFYQIPKSLLINPKYHKMSNTSKLMYAILKDRMELSRKNGWHDESGNIYLLFDQQEMADLLGTSRGTINRNMKELKDAGLIDSIRQGLGKPNKIYIYKLEIFNCGNQDVTKMLHNDVTKTVHKNVSDYNSSDTEYSDTDSSEYTDGLTDEIQPLIDFCQDNVEILTPFKLQMLEGYVTDFGIEWVQKGLELLASKDRSKQNMKYLGGVLNGWKRDGVPKPWIKDEIVEEEPISGAEFMRQEAERQRLRIERDERLAALARQQQEQMQKVMRC
jgi:DnaD/phage-associated family protein